MNDQRETPGSSSRAPTAKRCCVNYRVRESGVSHQRKTGEFADLWAKGQAIGAVIALALFGIVMLVQCAS